MKACFTLLLLILSVDLFAQEIDVEISVVQVVESEKRTFGEPSRSEELINLEGYLEKIVVEGISEYFLVIPRLGTKYQLEIKEKNYYYLSESFFGGRSTPQLIVSIHGHQLKRLMVGIGSLLALQYQNETLANLNRNCFEDSRDFVHSSCWIDTQPAISVSSYHPFYKYNFNFKKQQGMFYNKARRDSFNFLKQRISFLTNDFEGRNLKIELHIELDSAKF